MWNLPLDMFDIETSDDWAPCKWNKMYSSSKVMWKLLSCVWLFVTPWTVQSMAFSRPKYWSGKPFPSPGDLPTQGLNPGLPHCRILYQPSHREAPLLVHSRHLSEVNAQSGAVSLATLEASCLLHWVRRGNKLCRARAFPVAQRVKHLPAVQETWLWSLGEEEPPEEGMATTPVFLLGEFHG